MRRIESLDWLRGLMAFSIMIYHYTTWTFAHPDSRTLLSRLGIYGVCTFYILSGLSLTIVYNSKMDNAGQVGSFFVRRLFRILPLMWVATALNVVLLARTGQMPSPGVILMNLTALFGFIKPTAYLSVGAWSIGNELVFYALFPIAMIAYKRGKLWGNVVAALALLGELVFAFVLLKPGTALANQWGFYVNPFNQAYLFFSGVFIYFAFKNVKIKNVYLIPVLLAAVAALILYPASGDQINIVTGWSRLAFSAICFVLVACFFKLEVKLPRGIEVALNSLGIATYSVYLLHPFVYQGMSLVLNKVRLQNDYLRVAIAIAVTIVASLLVYRYYEEPFMRLGKKLTSRPARSVSVAAQE